MRRTVLGSALVLCLFSLIHTPSALGGPAPAPLMIGGERPAALLLPAAAGTGAKVPLVLFLHGYTGEAAESDAFFHVSAQRDQLGVAVLLPQGTKNQRGDRFWNAAPECCDFDQSGVDDSGYLAALIAEAQVVAPIDPARVYVMGHSNGGFMSYRLACDHPELVRGVVSVAGAFFKDPLLCWNPGRVNILQVHGTADETIPYLGNDTFRSATDSVQYWAMQESCTSMVRREEALDLAPAIAPGAATNETATVQWGGCEDGARVGLWSLDGAVHSPLLYPSWVAAALEFVR